MRAKIMGLLLAIVVVTSACMSQNGGEVMAEQPHVVKEIRIQPATTPDPTPYPDFDLDNLSIVLKEETKENEEQEDSEGGDIPDGSSDAPADATEAGHGPEGAAGESGANEQEDRGDNSGSDENADESMRDEECDQQSEEEAVTDWEYYGSCRITFYCPGSCCCGEYANGYTASGEEAISGWTVANGSLPFGTMVMIDGHEYCVTDRGVDGDQFDIFVDTHEEALQRGLYYSDVYIRR